MRYDLSSSRVTIGRRPENDIVLQDPHVSRTHARIRFKQGRYVLTDLDSKAGTLVNGRPIQEHVLRPGDQIGIAGKRFVFRVEAVEQEAAASGDTAPLSTDDVSVDGEK
jgi:pSer/pThr/pTyr-binding forkhead associated (FHA) protein